jgi:8-oxo-dGTP pyrophosphatase MutT (NUDIX family)
VAEGLFITSKARLAAADAVAAILVDPQGRYVLQRRDDKPGIFFPGHWGCFGGAVETGEPPLEAMRRELREELELHLDAKALKYFTRMDFDFAPLGGTSVFRIFYEVRISPAQIDALRLHEGQAVRHFDARELLLRERVTPYDAFAIWMHLRANRSSGA